MKSILPLLALPALLLSSCVSSNIGAKLDSIGKAVPTIHSDTYTGLYQLNGNYYMECEVRYMRYAPNFMDWYPDPVHWGMRTTYEEAPPYLNIPAPERCLVKLGEQAPELVKAADFDFRKARRIQPDALPKGLRYRIPNSLTTGWHFWSADLLKDKGEPRELSILPEQRTIGNHLRKPLVAAISWVVDVPLSIATSAVTATIGATTFFIAVVICGEPFH